MMRINPIHSGKVVSFGELGARGERTETFSVSHFKEQEKTMSKFVAEADKFTYDEVFKLLQPTTLKERFKLLKEMHMEKLTKIISKL